MNAAAPTPPRYSRNLTLAACLALPLLLGGCIGEQLQGLFPGSDSDAGSGSNTVTAASAVQSLGFRFVSDEAWDDTAVRKVLHTFAYGGHASDEQISTWAAMPPDQAIVEMLTFDEHNPKLSPVSTSNRDGLDTRSGTLRGLAAYWNSDDPSNGIPAEQRGDFLIAANPDARPQPGKLWVKAATSRGLNPFRQKIGLWETNHHMSVNLKSAVTPLQIVDYYDAIMNTLNSGASYEDVITTAATSAAVAMQFGHYKNRYRNGKCECNEDFAREYYQLFYGILGEYDPDYHETVTIKNTAKALTGLSIESVPSYGFTSAISYGSERHYPGILEILQASYWGENALERIEQLSRDAVNHPESLDNLPVKIISRLADDNLDDYKLSVIRNAWASMPQKNLLDFLRAYAISDIFHSPDRVKYLTSIERHMLLANKLILDNEEGYLDLYAIQDYQADGVDIFRPLHNVFGGQTGPEAADNSDIFRNNYNRVTLRYNRYLRASGDKYGRSWEKDWGSVISSSGTDGYAAGRVAEWLWNRFIGDGLKNFGPLERAHVYALLASGRDIVQLAYPDNLDTVVTSLDVTGDPAFSLLVDSLAGETLALDSTDSSERQTANARIGQAINFIVATPYIFAIEGR